MKFVEPIRSLKKIEQIKNQLRWSWKIRDLLLFELGMNSALRITDLLWITIGQVINEQGEINDIFEINEKKTGKVHKITITGKVKATLQEYQEKYKRICENRDNYLFFNSRRDPLWSKSIIRQHARILINDWCEGVWLTWRYWGHTLRKTWGYQARKQGIPMEIIQHKLNHSSMSITKRYLGITDDEIQKACLALDL